MNTSTGTKYQYVFVFEDGVGYDGASGGRMSFYRDGGKIGYRDVAFRLQQLEDVNNWLGRSQRSGDSSSNVEYDEVRIYSEALDAFDIYGHWLAGPDVPVLEALYLRAERLTRYMTRDCCRAKKNWRVLARSGA